MDRYLEPIKIAFITFPIIAALFTFPFLVFQYKKYGYINKIRSIVLYSLLLFFITAYYLVILPLPNIKDIGNFQKPITKYMQLIPFTFILDFLKETNLQWNQPSTYLNILGERALLQAVFNVILLMPLGIYLRYYFRKSLGKTIIITFLISLFFETTQVTGLYGIFKTPYRLFDVDDLILNTFGGILGYLLAPKITYFLPNSDKYDVNIDFKNMQLSFTRRVVAAIIDFIIVLSIIILLKSKYSAALVLISYYIFLPYKTNGRTVGKWMTRMQLKGSADKLMLKEISIRSCIFLLILSMQILLTFITPVLTIIYNLVLLTYIIFRTIENDKILFYEKISGTRNIIVLEEESSRHKSKISIRQQVA
ncbi:VanZ family protein [Maledivibacter halophilus]|uniref:Glycopeptide antibiotics resistance protein n=1 Tax=Maledivibacter halophilus TaxID=36842 RepID=A0A1T5LCL7_9FIRM|nr:VanZ family protein [Maledivibacter halophilus]SKC73757.1 Glycopeptide antibiotics resistance protein [Maledivibacter halophilus]